MIALSTSPIWILQICKKNKPMPNLFLSVSNFNSTQLQNPCWLYQVDDFDKEKLSFDNSRRWLYHTIKIWIQQMCKIILSQMQMMVTQFEFNKIILKNSDFGLIKCWIKFEFNKLASATKLLQIKVMVLKYWWWSIVFLFRTILSNTIMMMMRMRVGLT